MISYIVSFQLGEAEAENKLEDLTDSRTKKKKKGLKVKAELKHKEKDEDFNAIIEEFSKANYICAFEDCKSSTQIIYSNCEFCKNRFCLQHG